VTSFINGETAAESILLKYSILLCHAFISNCCMQHAPIIARFPKKPAIMAGCCMQKLHATIAHKTIALFDLCGHKNLVKMSLQPA